MIQTEIQDVPVQIDPYSFLAELQVLSGNPVQNYNKDTGKYEPDRSLVPCLLMPYVSVQDPVGIMNGSQDITGVEYYEGTPKADGTNRITSSTAGYVISDAGTPAHSLKVKKNVSYDNPLEIFSIFSFTDKRRNTQENVERSVILRTTIFDSNNYSLKLDKPKSWSLNPLDFVVNSSGQVLHGTTAQLYSGSTAVPDANAVYWWDVFENGVYRNFTDEEIEVFVDGKNPDGSWSKTITLDVRMFRNIVLRCRAAYYSGVKPGSPTSDNLQDTTSIKIEMPPTLRVNTRQTKGIRVDARMNNTVGFEAVMSYNIGTVSTSKSDYFKYEWYVKSAKPGSTAIKAGEGRTVEFTPASYKFDPNYHIGVYCKVYLYAMMQVVVSGTSAVMSGTKLIISTKYE